MWTIALNFVLKFWKPLLSVLLLCSIPWLISLYNARLVNKGRAEVQVVFDAYVAEQKKIAEQEKQRTIEAANKAREFERIATEKAQQLAELARKEVQYETKTKVIYRNCKLPDSGLQLYNKAAEQ